MISAAIFDVDGTLIDSVDAHARAWQEALATFGHKIPLEALRSQMGKGGDQLLPWFLEAKDVALHSRAIEELRSELFKQRGFPSVRPFPLVRKLFQALHARDIQVVLASSSSAEEIQDYQRLLNVEGLVNKSISKDDAEHTKPAPDIFAAALKGLGPIERVRVIGDSPFDMEAARKVGIPSIGVLSGKFPEEELRRAGCRQVFRDPEDLLGQIDLWTQSETKKVGTAT